MESFAERDRHPLLAGVEALEAVLDDMAGFDPTYLSPEDKQAVMVELSRIESRVASVRLRTMAVADDAAAAEGARDPAALLTHHTRGDAQGHRRDLALAQSLDRRWTVVSAALGAGDLGVAQALVITRALDDLPSDVPEETRRQAERHLVAEARHHGPRELRLLGRKILEVVAPDDYEEQEARQLEAEERRARRSTSLTMSPAGDGSTDIRIRVPDAVAARLRTYLEAYTSPRHRDGHPGGGEADRIPSHRRLGLAFCSFLEAVDPVRLPVHGGSATTLIVTIPLAELREELSAAGVAGHERLSASEARRLACTADIVPAVLGGDSEVLDLGRTSRFFKPAQRKAMVVRDQECRAEGCSVPATWCEAHHWGTAWSRGGKTDLKDGVLLCPWHHHRAHDPTFEASRLPNGDVRFTKKRPPSRRDT